MISINSLKIMDISDVSEGVIFYDRANQNPPMLMGEVDGYAAGCCLESKNAYQAFDDVPKEDLSGKRIVIENIDFEVELDSRIPNTDLQAGDLGLTTDGVILAVARPNARVRQMVIKGGASAKNSAAFWFRNWQVVVNQDDRKHVVFPKE